MAPGKSEKKRKATAVSDPPAKQTKKVAAKAVEATKDAAPKPTLKKKQNGAVKAKDAEASHAPKANGEPARQTKPRKRAADFLSDEEDDEAGVPVSTVPKKSDKKKTKKDTESAPAGKKATSKAKKVEVPEESDEEEDEDVLSAGSGSEDGAEDDGEDDQTAALIKGFESSGDEDDSGDEGYTPDKPVPKIPDSKKAEKKIMKKQKKESGEVEEPGTVYIGRIPHGFYEHEMRAYFSQFGEITRLRLSRNRLTGRSKHYAFVEFASTNVAKIVAETMDNYLMYGHILKCKFVPAEQLHPEIWKGANRRFKRTPWNRIEKKRLEKGKTREQWSKRIEQEQQKRQAKADKLKALGYEIDLPQLKSVDDVRVQDTTKAIEAGETVTEEPVKAIEAPAASEDTPKAKKGKKTDQGTSKQETATEAPATKTKKKAKKATKAKA